MRPGVLKLIPAEPGVYRFRNGRGRVLYIGRAVDLRRRVASYWGDLRDRPHLRRMVASITTIDVLACACEHEAAWLERNLLERSLPRWNRVIGGLESPVYIDVSTSARAPGVRVSFRPGADVTFGPYLSGTKTRHAVAALHRLYPLAYTRDRLTGGEREIARKLGVTPDQRESLVAAVIAVLSRNDDAVAAARAALESLRDKASVELAYERAQRLHSELLGLEWVCSPQRVTSAHDDSSVFFGWSDGILVRFDISAGRLCNWQVSPCSASAARPKLATTPPHWTDFATRNAALAAKLRSAG